MSRAGLTERRPAARLLERPRVWRGVVAANGIAMTAFLWHLTAMLAVYGALISLGGTLPAPAGAAWWAQAPLRVAAATALTAALVAVFRRAERPPAPTAPARPQAPLSGPGAALGVALALLGVLGLSAVGFGGLLDGHSATLIAVRVTAPAAVLMAVTGWALVERAGRTGDEVGISPPGRP